MNPASTCDEPIYAQSKELVISRDMDLEEVLQIIKKLASLAAAQS